MSGPFSRRFRAASTASMTGFLLIIHEGVLEAGQEPMLDELIRPFIRLGVDGIAEHLHRLVRAQAVKESRLKLAR